MITLGNLRAHARDVEAREAGIATADIEVARRAGMLPADVAALRAFTAAEPGWCIVVRCPKSASYAWQDLLPAKIGATGKKSGDSGLVSIHKLKRAPGGAPLFRDGEPIIDAAIHVSDDDLTGVWQHWKGAWQRVRITAAGGTKRGGYGAGAAEMLRRLNRSLATRIQHGCQDDWASADNRDVRPDDGFAGFLRGEAGFIDGAATCRGYFAGNGLSAFPYDPVSGAFIG